MATKITKEVLKDLTKEELCDRISIYIRDLYNTSLRKMRDENNYSYPAWSEYQADQIGFQRALIKLNEFLSFDKEEI